MSYHVDASIASSEFVFHQLPVVNTSTFTAQYHIVIRVNISSRGDVLGCEAQCFLISYERNQPLWPRQFDDTIRTDQESD